MDRRLVAVCSTAALLTFIFVDSSIASTKPRRTVGTQPMVLRSQTSAGTRSNSSKTKRTHIASECVSCAERIAENRKGHRNRREAKTAKILPCHPRNYVDPKIAANYKTALRDMNRAGIQPQITSVWRSSEDQEQLYLCSTNARCRRTHPGIYRALPPGKSLHEAGFAVDMSGIAAGPRGKKRLTPRGRRIVGIMRKHGFKWRYGLADPAHFEADPRKHGYRTVKQAITQTRTTCQVNLANSKARLSKKAATKVVAAQVQSRVRARVEAQAAATGMRRHAGRIRT